MPQSAWSTKTNSFQYLSFAILASLFVHAFLYCSFFFNTDRAIEPGLGIVDVELTYRALNDPSRDKSKYHAVSIPTEINKTKKSTSQEPTQDRAETAPLPSVEDSRLPEEASSAAGENATKKYGRKITVWPKVLRERKVDYPAQAKLSGLQGTVSLKITIDEKGVPQNIEVIEGPGQGLNEAAAMALKGFLFSPAFVGDEAVPVRIVYKYKFQIREIR